ncbi:MAG: hypothetical protein QOK27_1924, partial [Gemmatimonadales bacterium]|nr:hypothetical protein [Gemmatimonadales bacterium]
MARETKRATVIWQQGLRFTGSEPGGPAITVD